jgi:ribose 5-phosphate isomerase
MLACKSMDSHAVFEAVPPYITAGHNYILDCVAPPDVNLADEAIGSLLKSQVGVVEHGIFSPWRLPW